MVPPTSKISRLVALLASWGLLLILIMRSGDCEAVEYSEITVMFE